jgi:outer membrane protein assembly factor BamC
MKKHATLALACAAAFGLAGCSIIDAFTGGGKTKEYKGAQARTTQPLEVPPELTAPTMDDRFAVPDPREQTSYSAYAKANTPGAPVAGTAAAANTVLPKVEGVRVERAGDQRWLVVRGEPDRVWPVIREYWIEAGYPLVTEEPAVGIMETDWVENKDKVPQDFIRRTVGRVLPGLWSLPRRDKFRTRLEKGADPATTDVFVSNRAVEEIYTNNNQDRTAWQPLPADRELEAEMLNRIVLKIGGDQIKLAAANKPQAPVPGTRATGPVTPVVAAAPNAVLENGGAGPLVVNDGFDRAWRRVGLALDRVGFTVEDRDRSKGLFFVRYIDPDRDIAAEYKSKESFVDKLKFWKAAPKNTQPQYRVQVSDAGASMSQVLVQDGKGTPEKSSTGRKILGLLYEQLK